MEKNKINIEGNTHGYIISVLINKCRTPNEFNEYYSYILQLMLDKGVRYLPPLKF